MQPQPLEKITIQGYKSLRSLVDFKLEKVNVLIGANGAGKSNFISFFRLVNDMIKERLAFFVNMAGGADRLLFNGPKVTTAIKANMYFAGNGYEFTLAPTEDNRLIFLEEKSYFTEKNSSLIRDLLGSGHSEARLVELSRTAQPGSVAALVYSTIKNWSVYHFHDTSSTAQIRRQTPVRDNEILQPDAGNLAAFLLRLKNEHEKNYGAILRTIQAVAPFFKDFHFRPKNKGSEKYIELEWKQVNTDSIFFANQLSDGTLRLMAMVTALLQPEPPRTLLFDEPELGLHPYALQIITELMQSVSDRIQLIISTQSVPFVNLFNPQDIIVAERSQGETLFNRLNPDELKVWLEDDYAMGQLWEKNVIGGGVNHD